MTVEQVHAMSDMQLRIKVAKLCGWNYPKPRPRDWGPLHMTPPGALMYKANALTIPNYPCDLNVMHKAETALNNPQRAHYLKLLKRFGISDWGAHTTTARQRAEAFVLTRDTAARHGQEEKEKP